jgi:hypothetical protein
MFLRSKELHAVHIRTRTSEQSFVSLYCFLSVNVDNVAGCEYVKLRLTQLTHRPDGGGIKHL